MAWYQTHPGCLVTRKVIDDSAKTNRQRDRQENRSQSSQREKKNRIKG